MDVPAGLGERGLSIWEAMATEDVPRNALVLEAAPLADRLDELDNIIQGKGVLTLMQFRLDVESGGAGEYNVEVKFQNGYAEARRVSEEGTPGSVANAGAIIGVVVLADIFIGLGVTW